MEVPLKPGVHPARQQRQLRTGGHIGSFQSPATLCVIGFGHFWHWLLLGGTTRHSKRDGSRVERMGSRTIVLKVMDMAEMLKADFNAATDVCRATSL